MNINYTPVDKLDVAEQIVLWLNMHKRTMTYGELTKIVGLPPFASGMLLDSINRRHAKRGGTNMITGCVINAYGTVGDGYHECAKTLNLTP